MTVATFSLPELVGAARAGGTSDLLAAFDAALSDPGAFRLVDLPIAEELVAQMHAVTEEFFELPLETKAGYRYEQDQFVGWCGGEFLGRFGSVDRKEMYHIGPRVASTLKAHGEDGSVPGPGEALSERALATCSLWPAVPSSFISTWHSYFAAMQQTAVLMGTVLTRLLGVPEAEWFATMAGNWADLAANYYPPLPAGDDEAPVYNAPHRDLTIFTVLYQDQSPIGGLSVQAADGSWEKVEPRPGTYVVNVGELLTYLSAGRWRAAPHQVTPAEKAPRPGGSPVARISVPFFYRPSDQKVISSFVDPGAPTIAVGDWVLEKKRAASATA